MSRIDLDYWPHRYELLTGSVIRHIILPELRNNLDVAGETVIPRTRLKARKVLAAAGPIFEWPGPGRTMFFCPLALFPKQLRESSDVKAPAPCS